MGYVEKIYGLSESKFELTVQGILEATAFAGATEIQVRENENLAILGEFFGPGPFSGRAVHFNEGAIKEAQRSQSVLRDVRRRVDVESIGIRELFADSTVRRLFKEARSDFAHRLAEYTVKTVEYKEMLEIWDEVEQLTGSADELFEYVDSGLGQFIEARQQPGRGTQPHSPLPWWKWCMIAFVLCACATAIAACVIYFVCAATTALIAAAAFAIFLIIAWAC